MKIAFYTLGCKTNQFETQALETLFEQRGHRVVPFDSFADVYIVNTCTVTALSDKKSRNAARRCKKINPAATLIVCGCYSQIEPEAARQMCGADIVVGAGYVSGRHARFSLMGQNLFVEDLGSTNGTAVNGQVIGEPVALKNGDVVNVGDVAIRVRFA